MQPYQIEFIQLALSCDALKFGSFTLKSGRVSPYFFNAGEFYTGKAIAALGRAYAQTLVNTGEKFDMLFGPAYKGIPLAAATAGALADVHGIDIPYCYNRKEAKQHGEGGSLVGPKLSGRVAIIDDVITAGTAIREALSLIESSGAEPAVIAVGLNRQEKGKNALSAIDELVNETSVPVISIIKLEDIIEFLKDADNPSTLEQIEAYRNKYGV